MSAFSLLDKQFEKVREKYNDYIEIDDSEYSKSKCFMLYCSELVFKDLDIATIEEGIIDSGYRGEIHDYGIDGLYLTANGESINSLEELNDFNDDTKFELSIFQYKKSTTYELGDFIKFKEGINRMFVVNDILDSENHYLYEKLRFVKEILEEVFIRFSIAQIKINLYYAFKGLETHIENDDLPKYQISKAVEILKEIGYINVDFKILGVQKLIDLSKKSEGIIDVIKYEKGFKYITDTDINKKLNGYICMVKGDEIAKLVKKHQSSLFEANIRDYYAKNDINHKIIDTCTSESEAKFFWSYNNGLTITCNKVEDLPNDQYKLYGIQIVNGCQTSNALYTALRNKDRADILNQKEILDKKEQKELEVINNRFLNKNTTILIKIVETKDPDFIYSITEKTNSQTPIKTFSLKANESIQQNIEQYLKQFDIFYERRINYYKNQGKSNVISIQKMFQLFLSQYLFKPSQVKTKPKQMFSNDYDKVFSIQNNPKQYHYDLYRVAIIVDQKINKQILEYRKKKNETDPYDLMLLSYCKLHLGPLLLHAVLGNYDRSIIIKNTDRILSDFNNSDKLNSYFLFALANLKRIVQDFAGKKKENIPENVKKTDLDSKIAIFIKSQKRLTFYVKS
jgi:AIPR protein